MQLRWVIYDTWFYTFIKNAADVSNLWYVVLHIHKIMQLRWVIYDTWFYTFLKNAADVSSLWYVVLHIHKKCSWCE